MTELTKQEKGSLIFNYGFYIMREKGLDVNDELIKQITILEACAKSEHPVPKQLLPLNELKEHLRQTENIFPVRNALRETSLGTRDLSEMMLNEIGKYVIDFPEEAVEIMKSNINN